MFEAETSVIELESRLGRVGSIQAWDPWKSRQSAAHAKWWVSKIASLSYGNEEAKNPEKLFQRIVDMGHLSCLEFVPVPYNRHSLPFASARTYYCNYCSKPEENGFVCYMGPDIKLDIEENPASAFLVECPIFVARQWMRHRSFSYLEMSRRYVKEAKVPARFYGEPGQTDDELTYFYTSAIALYEKLLGKGEPPELSRRVLPVGMMTKFWCAGFDRDWEHFCNLRTDSHAQEEIRVFANYIKNYIGGKRGS